MRRAYAPWSGHSFLPRRFALSAALLGLAAGLLHLDATHSGFTARSSAGGSSFSTGIVDLSLPVAGPGSRLTVDATGIVPGDQMERVVDLTNGGTLNLSGITLSTTAPLSSALDTDTTHGLQVEHRPVQRALDGGGHRPRLRLRVQRDDVQRAPGAAGDHVGRSPGGPHRDDGG